MRIDIVNLKAQRTKLDKIIESSNIDNLNLYNQLYQLETCWHDNNSKQFMIRINKEREQAKRKIKDLEGMSGLLKFIEVEYGKIGKEIFFDLKEKEKFDEKMDECIDAVQNLINMYNQLDYRLQQMATVRNSLNDLVNIRDKSIKYKEKVNSIIAKIEENETLIYNRIDNLKMGYVLENDWKNYN